ncbi:MAG: hypothetical protein J6R84_05920 [Alistipes sp.]|nr:hypothetical protein [Alistipes sp.]
MAEGVSSANIVGYVTYTTQADKMDIYGAPFVNVGGEDINIQSVQLGAGADASGKDVIMFFDPNTQAYTIYYWMTATYSADYQTVYGPGWADAGWVRQDTTINPGQGFWLQTKSAVAVTVPGQVLAGNQNTTTTVGGKMDIYTGIYPVAMNIQDCKITSGADATGKDVIMMFDPATMAYSIYYWMGTTYSADYVTTYGAGWADAGWVRQDVALNVGQGFWLQTVGDCEIEFTAPQGL